MIQAEQSSVGNVFVKTAIFPPIVGNFSTNVTSLPESARSSADWIPAMPPPIINTLSPICIFFSVSGLSSSTFATDASTTSIAFTVAISGLSLCAQEQCSLRFAHSNT